MRKNMTVAVVGMGALGMLFGHMIQQEIGENNFWFVMDEKRYKKYSKKKFTINDKPVELNMIPTEQAHQVDLVIVAVKYPGLQSALDTIEPLVGSDTTILSLLNGVTSEEVLRERFGDEHVIDCVAQGMDAMHFGSSLVYTKPGQIHIGIGDNASEKKQYLMDQICKFFHGIGFPFIVEDDIKYRMWCKFMLNVGINQVCMAYDIGYGKAMRPGSKERMMLISAMREVALIAQAEEINIGEVEIKEYIEILETLDPKATPSMGQDRINRNPSEVDAFAGEVIKRGLKHHIPTPTNDYLYHRITKIEKDYEKSKKDDSHSKSK